MDTMEAILIAEGVEQVETQEEYIRAWQCLIDCGVVWSLQGWFGRVAESLIEEGFCHE